MILKNGSAIPKEFNEVPQEFCKLLFDHKVIFVMKKKVKQNNSTILS